MNLVKITVMRNIDDPADDLRVASRVRRDLWAHSPAEVDPNSATHGTHRDENGNAYFQFTTNFLEEVKRVVQEYGHTDRVRIEIVDENSGPECAGCGNIAGPVLPAVCRNCGFRDISPCPYCNQLIARQSYLSISGDLFKCPECHHRVRFHFHEPMFNAAGHYNQPLVVVEKVEEVTHAL